jgi:type II secretory pathway component PulM
LIAFGITGLLLLVAGGYLVLAAMSTLEDAATSLQPAAAALTRVADSASNASASLTTTSEAAERGATLATSVADSFERLSALGSFDLLGTRPFAGLSQDFSRVGSDARLLASNLATVGGAMRTNVADSSAVATELRALADQLDAAGPIDLQLGLAKIVVLGLLAWLAVPALASIWLGGSIRRGHVFRG